MRIRNQFVVTAAVIAAAAAGALFSQSARADLLLSDGFNYPSGTALAGNGNWAGGNTNLSIGTGNLTYSGLADLGGNDLSILNGVSATSTTNNFENGGSITSGTVYFSFVLSPTVLPTANNYLAALNSPSTSPGGSGDALSVYVGAGNAGSYQIGIRHSGIGSGATYTNSAGAKIGGTLNSTNFVVVGYTIVAGSANDSISLWWDPTPGGSQPAPDITVSGGGNDAAGIGDIGFKAQSAATAGQWLFDDARVGDTWADVTPAIPEPSTWALVGSGLVLMLGFIRRRRS